MTRLWLASLIVPVVGNMLTGTAVAAVFLLFLVVAGGSVAVIDHLGTLVA